MLGLKTIAVASAPRLRRRASGVLLVLMLATSSVADSGSSRNEPPAAARAGTAVIEDPASLAPSEDPAAPVPSGEEPGSGRSMLPEEARARAPRDILVSRQLLEGSHLAVGETISLSNDPRGSGAVPFRIVGVYEPVPDPMKLTSRRWEARLHLPDLLAMTADPKDPISMESVTSINVALKDPSDAFDFSVDVQKRMPGLVANPAKGASEDAVPFLVLKRFHYAIALVTVIGASAFLMALMVMRAEERRETVGVLRLIGLSRRRILVEVLFEGLLIAACGAVFGVLFARVTEGSVNRIFQWRYDTTLVFLRVTLPIALRSVALAIPLGVMAGLVASWTLLRRDISGLLRR